MSLSCSRCELDASPRGDDNETLSVQSRRHRIVIRDDLNRLDGYTLRFQLSPSSRRGVLFTPVQRACIGMDPEETAMTIF